MVLILMQAFPRVGLHETLAQKMATTWWQEFKKISPTAPLERLQASKRKRALQVNHKTALKTPLWRSKQTKFCWVSSKWQTTAILQILITTFREFPCFHVDKVANHNNAHVSWQIRKVWAVWRSFPNKPQNSQSANRRWPIQLSPFSHEVRRVTNVQKH